jgi:putative nucleotidyltransferase with HDIG domain
VDDDQTSKMNANAKNIAARFTKAMTFPAVVFQLDDMLNDGVSSISDVARLISGDPSLTATLLRFANNALYGFSGEVSTVDRAISLIGMREIRDLVLAVSVRKAFDKFPNDIIIMVDFWRHSLCCALASERLTEVVRQSRQSQRAVLFTAGLIHDIGKLAMVSQIPDACEDVRLRAQSRDDAVDIFQLERELIGFDHCEVGAEIAKAWHFPEILQDTISFHHVPDEAPRHQFESYIVHLGNTIAKMVELGLGGPLNVPPISSSALAYIGLDEDQFLSMAPHVHAMFQKLRPVFGLPAFHP